MRARRSRDERSRSAAGSARSRTTRSPAATGSSPCSTARARSPSPASSTCSPASAAGGRGEVGPSCRGRSRSPRPRPAEEGVRLDFLVEGVGPGTDRLCELEPGERVWVTGPLGNAFSTPKQVNPERGRGDPRRRRHRHRPAGHLAPPPGRTGASPYGSCSASATRAHSGGLSELFCAGGTLCPTSASPARTATPATTATSPTSWRRCSPATTPTRPSSTPAARRRCWRRCARSAPRPASPASWRWSRRWPAASAPASAARCRSPSGGYLRLCVDGPVAAGRRRPRGGPCLSSAASS